jgi:hypothetical protein
MLTSGPLVRSPVTASRTTPEQSSAGAGVADAHAAAREGGESGRLGLEQQGRAVAGHADLAGTEAHGAVHRAGLGGELGQGEGLGVEVIAPPLAGEEVPGRIHQRRRTADEGFRLGPLRGGAVELLGERKPSRSPVPGSSVKTRTRRTPGAVRASSSSSSR